MAREQPLVRIVLSAIVGIGFVAPMATLVFQMAGLGRTGSILGGTVVGIAVAVYVYPRMRRVQE